MNTPADRLPATARGYAVSVPPASAIPASVFAPVTRPDPLPRDVVAPEPAQFTWNGESGRPGETSAERSRLEDLVRAIVAYGVLGAGLALPVLLAAYTLITR